ncbi:MAG: hypothetical protein E7370_06005 [Clostridiales bacterium]|nr:hypothetical protein [Clostridiales bacterium]
MPTINMFDNCLVTPFKNPLICIFDSGVGGLNLLKICAKKLTNYDFCYFADNFSVPYGNLREEEVFVLVNQKFKIMQALGCRAAVIACNTATAVCVEKLRKIYSFPIIGIQPALKQAYLRGKKYTVWATNATVNSPSFKSLFSKYFIQGSKVVALPDLASEIEKNIFNLQSLNASQLLQTVEGESLVLGCTHYSYLLPFLKIGANFSIFDGIVGTADHLCTILGRTDHFSNFKQKITFLFGDISKNKGVYDKLIKNQL